MRRIVRTTPDSHPGDTLREVDPGGFVGFVGFHGVGAAGAAGGDVLAGCPRRASRDQGAGGSSNSIVTSVKPNDSSRPSKIDVALRSPVSINPESAATEDTADLPAPAARDR